MDLEHGKKLVKLNVQSDHESIAGLSLKFCPRVRWTCAELRIAIWKENDN